MKITTWNVNGMRAIISRNGFNWIQKIDPDIFCLQEIKADQTQIDLNYVEDLSEYHAYWNSAVKMGYSGVLTFLKTKPVEVSNGLGVEIIDKEGRFIRTLLDGFSIINVYFPNGRRDHSRVEFKIDFYEKVIAFVKSLHSVGENVILCGDFNTAHQEIDLKNPKQNMNTSGFLRIERDYIDALLQENLIDIYRKRYPEKEEYTWWTYRAKARERNIGWRLDYFLISEKLEERVIDIIIHTDIYGSDHCPVTLILED
jgi:exodeoxyribonuclease III